ncbi:MAG TPA: phytoene/squalene synthase family protein [Bryobacteraceae bacterium]|nr:phytoene/squalene synthase family protein [Bryobacteraceae bacterium]
MPPRPAHSTNALDGLYSQAAEAARTGSHGFSLATRLFPLDLRRAAHAVYWFCYYTRRLASQAPTRDQGRQDLDLWASMATAGLRGQIVHHPVLEVFLDTLEHRQIPRDLPLEMIEGVRIDLDQDRYRSFSQLRSRCHRVTGTVTLMMTHVVGFRGPALENMADLGLAIELTAILRDLGEQLAQGRTYLPLEEMESFGYPEADLEKHVRNDAFRGLMRFQAERARGYYHQAEPGLALLDQRGRFAMKAAFDIYRNTLRHIEASDFDVFHRRPAVPMVERAWITARSMAGPITRSLWRTMSA